MSNRTHVTHMGHKKKDEMCFLFLMYYVDEGHQPDVKTCFDLRRGYSFVDEFQPNEDKDASTYLGYYYPKGEDAVPAKLHP